MAARRIPWGHQPAGSICFSITKLVSATPLRTTCCLIRVYILLRPDHPVTPALEKGPGGEGGVGDKPGTAHSRLQRGAEGGPLPRRPADLLYALRPFLSKRPDCRAVRRFAGRGQLVRGILGPVVSKHLFIPALKKEPPLSGMRRPPSGGKLSSRRTAILRPPSCSGSLSTSDRLIIHRLAPVDNTDFSRRTPS